MRPERMSNLHTQHSRRLTELGFELINLHLTPVLLTSVAGCLSIWEKLRNRKVQ